MVTKKYNKRYKELNKNEIIIKSLKTCCICKIEKDIECFNKNSSQKDGRSHSCKECRSVERNKYKDYSKNYQKEYYKNNKEKLKKYKEDNKPKTNLAHSQRLKSDIPFKIRKNMSKRLWKTLKQQNINKKNSILLYIGCSLEHLKNHLESTLDPSWDAVHIDHIIPCCLYDFTNEDEIKKCFNWRNLRYIPGKENLEKNGRLQLNLVEKYDIKDLLPNAINSNIPNNNTYHLD